MTVKAYNSDYHLILKRYQYLIGYSLLKLSTGFATAALIA